MRILQLKKKMFVRSLEDKMKSNIWMNIIHLDMQKSSFHHFTMHFFWFLFLLFVLAVFIGISNYELLNHNVTWKMVFVSEQKSSTKMFKYGE